MLYKLSFKNIKKSFKDYAIYFFTLILGVAIFYVFNAIESQTVLLDLNSSQHDLIELLVNMLSGVSVFVSFILGFLIIYASRFLIKRRNKEFGIYMTLGMGKRKISLILFIETLLIGGISLAVGLGLGVLASQFMSLLVSNLFEADMTKFEFVFSTSACTKTLIYFGIMYLLVMIFNTIIVSKCRLIELLHGSKKSEEVKVKNPYICIIVFLISCLILGRAYYLVTDGIGELYKFEQILIPIAMGSISTFFIFWSLSGLILKLVMSIRGLYYKGLNSFVLRQFSSKINTMVFSMSVICIMLFITICVLSSSLSIKNSLNANLDVLAPADIEFMKSVDFNSENSVGYSEETLSNFNLSSKETLERLGFDVEENFKEYVELDVYNTPKLTLSDTLGSKVDYLLKQFKFLNVRTEEDILAVSEYNKVARLYGLEEFSLEEDEYMIVADFESMYRVRNEVLKTGETISLFGHTLKPKYSECQNGFIELSSNNINGGIVLVADSIVDSSYKKKNFLIGNYKAKTKEEKIAIENKIKDLINSENVKEYNFPNTSSRLEIAEASGGLGALVTFLGLYLGIIFLISSAAILALKELSESADNKERYMMIRKLGADESIINRSLFRQIGIFFMAPLILALIHSIFGIKFCTIILEGLGTNGLLPSIIMTGVFLLLIYGGYFLVTYISSKRIIRQKF